MKNKVTRVKVSMKVSESFNESFSDSGNRETSEAYQEVGYTFGKFKGNRPIV